MQDVSHEALADAAVSGGEYPLRVCCTKCGVEYTILARGWPTPTAVRSPVHNCSAYRSEGVWKVRPHGLSA